MSAEVLDLFAGPGGWDVAARDMGLDPLGIERDSAACLTRAAAGLRTVRADVSTTVIDEATRLHGLIASPPCQTFSTAGKGAGRAALDDVLTAVDRVAAGLPIGGFDDPRTALVVEPLRYVLLHEPDWIAWEQVPPVLPVWEACAEALRAQGYNVWTGKLSAEQYGVPQTRKRSVLIASRSRGVGEPPVTHRRYKKGVAQHEGDPALLPWVSMAEALGLSCDRRLVQWRGAGRTKRHGTRPDRSLAEPAFTMAGLGGSGSGALRWIRMGNHVGSTVRHLTQPSPTVMFGHRSNAVDWHAERPPTRGELERSDARPSSGVRVSVQEAAVLQSFPADYPWRGTKTKQYEQVGNAIPPILAQHILAEATGLAMELRSEAVA